MSSYHNSFSYLEKNSKNDFGWIVASFDPDNGEMDSYLSQDQVYTDSYNGSRRILYGTKWNTVSTIKVTVIKQSGGDFSVSECRNAYRWLTGNPQANWLDLYSNGVIQYSFLVTCSDVKPYKLDARTVGLVIYFESISPWAYSPKQYISIDLSQNFTVDANGILYSTNDDALLNIGDDGTLYSANNNAILNIDNGALCSLVSPDKTNSSGTQHFMKVSNPTDDLYSYVYLDTVFKNNNSTFIKIHNKTIDETTIISSMSINEIITISSDKFITSDKPNKMFGNTFNFVWPRLAPGINEIAIDSDGTGSMIFVYRYPIKIGDCAMDIDVSGGDICCGDYPDDIIPTSVSWNDITNTPTTLEGYGITNAYNTIQVDSKIEAIDVNVDQQELYDMLTSVLSK